MRDDVFASEAGFVENWVKSSYLWAEKAIKLPTRKNGQLIKCAC